MLADYFNGVIETLVLVGKKNGKSTLLGALALYHLCTTPNAECVIAAASRDQATILFDQAFGFVRRSPQLQERVVVKRGFREIRSLRDQGRIRVLASDVDTADGVIPTLALVDELHRHKSAGLYGVFRDGLGPRHGRMLTISTAGDDDESPLGVMRKQALAQPGLTRKGAYTHVVSPGGEFAMHEWALSDGDDVHDMKVVKTANPASWQTLEALRRRHDSPSMQPWQWGRFACGLWLAGENSAISPVDWAACGVAGLRIPDGEGVFLGLDLGWKWDTTALVPVWPHDDVIDLGVPWILEPPRNGSSLDEEDIEAAVFEAAERWKVRGIVFDRNAGGQQLAQRLEKRHGFTVIDHSQDPAPMAVAAERLAECVRAGAQGNPGAIKLRHPEDPRLSSHILAAVAKRTIGEKWRLAKAKKPIDAAISTAMGVSIAMFPPVRERPAIERLA